MHPPIKSILPQYPFANHQVVFIPKTQRMAFHVQSPTQCPPKGFAPLGSGGAPRSGVPSPCLHTVHVHAQAFGPSRGGGMFPQNNSDGLFVSVLRLGLTTTEVVARFRLFGSVLFYFSILKISAPMYAQRVTERRRRMNPLGACRSIHYIHLVIIYFFFRNFCHFFPIPEFVDSEVSIFLKSAISPLAPIEKQMFAFTPNRVTQHLGQGPWDPAVFIPRPKELGVETQVLARGSRPGAEHPQQPASCPRNHHSAGEGTPF